MKKIILIIYLLGIFNVLSSQNLVSRLIEKKPIVPVDNQTKTIEVVKSANQFTDNTREDIELYAKVNPTDSNNIVVSWMNLDPSGTATQPLFFEMKYTLDGGQTWESTNANFMPHHLTSNRVVSGGGDPVIVFDKNGRMHFTWLYLVAHVISNDSIFLDLVLYYGYSDDKGASLTRPDNDTIAWGVFDYELGEGITAVDSGRPPDKEWLALNPQTNDLFISTTEFYDVNAINDIWGIRKKPADNIDSVSEHILIPPDTLLATSQGEIVYDNKGILHAIYPAYKDTNVILAPQDSNVCEYLYYQYSTDEGQTWSDTSLIAKVWVNNMTTTMQNNYTSSKAYNRLFSCAGIAVDTSGGQYDGRIYAIWNSNDTNYFTCVNVMLNYSDDTGKTWSNQVIVNTDGSGDYKFHHRPSIFVTPNGTIVMSWYDTRNAEIPDVYYNDYYVAVSTDGGQTFKELKVNDQAFNYNDIQHSFGVGEYYQVTATNSKIYVFWSQFGTGSDLEIYNAIVPIDLDVTAIEYQPITSNISIDLYPNPVSDVLKINLTASDEGITNISVFSLDGKKLYSNNYRYTYGTNNYSIDVSDLESGQYVLTINTLEGQFQRVFSVRR